MNGSPDDAMPGRRRECAVLGAPVVHSLSPVIHRAAYRHLGLDWRYSAHEVDEETFADFIAGLDEDWRGLSLTMPLKRVAFQVATQTSDLARRVGAANTLIRSDDGWFAENTDVPGFIAALRERGVPAPETVCVWGGGATAASVLAAMGLFDAGSTHVHARSAERAQAALDVAEAFGHSARHAGWDVTEHCHEAQLIVNTAPGGAVDAYASTLAGAAAPARVLFDVIYDPWPTPLAAGWSAGGGVVVNGLDLLVHQALEQITLMTGSEVPVKVLRDSAEQALATRTAT
nr:shikimate dehydrogenase [Phytoactinopolyspora alkaliphila]